jgi:hypothetical protein
MIEYKLKEPELMLGAVILLCVGFISGMLSDRWIQIIGAISFPALLTFWIVRASCKYA